MLRVDLRELARGRAMETRGELKHDDPAFDGTEITLKQPVVVAGRLQSIGEGRFYWQGTARTAVEGECRRCLTPDATEIDITPAVREELVLAAPRYVVCRDDCKGLCPQCGRDLNAGPCGCSPVTEARWQPLKALKDKLRS